MLLPGGHRNLSGPVKNAIYPGIPRTVWEPWLPSIYKVLQITQRPVGPAGHYIALLEFDFTNCQSEISQGPPTDPTISYYNSRPIRDNVTPCWEFSWGSQQSKPSVTNRV